MDRNSKWLFTKKTISERWTAQQVLDAVELGTKVYLLRNFDQADI
jgi:hypothetical protein